jgi:hypothetical protein
MEAIQHEGQSHRCSERLSLAQELVQAATEFRLYSLLALARLTLWLLLPSPLKILLSSPSLPRLRSVFGIDALGSYGRLKAAAGGLSAAYDLTFHNEVIARL